MAKRKRKSAEEKALDRRRNQLLSEGWGDRITAAKKQKKEYIDTSEEVMKFFRAKHDHLYESTSDFMDFTGAATVSVPKVAQMKGSLGPRLYVAAPTRTVTPRTQDGVMVGMTRVLGAALTYTAREARFARTIRNVVDDGLISGRLVLRQVWDDVRKIITSTYVDSMDLLFDPDFTSIEDANWIAIRHREPLWQLERRLPKWRTKGLQKHALSGGVIGVQREDDSHEKEEDDDEDSSGRATATVVEWWEILSKMGVGLRMAGMPRPEVKKWSDEKDFVRLAIVLGHEILLEEGDWDVPLYLDRTWPISHVDFVETPRASWPQSPMGLVLPLQKAADLLTSLKLSSCKNRERVLMFIDKKFAVEAQEAVRHGTSADLIPVDLPQGYSLDMVLKIAELGQGNPETAQEREFLLKEMEQTLGTTSLVTGGQDQESQDRSATATQLRNSAAEIRTADLENKVSELLTDAACKEALAWRLFVDEEDIASIVRADQINLFYVSVMLPGETEIPVRPLKIDEEADEDASLTLKDLYPGAATYFNTAEEAMSAGFTMWQGLMDPSLSDPRLAQIRDALLAQGLDEFGMPFAIKPDLVTAERVWQDTAGLTAEELMRELSYEIEAGKGVKFDKAAERANIDNLLQTALPAAMQMSDMAAVNKFMTLRYDAYQVPLDKRVFFTIAPAPEEGEEEGDDEESEESEGPPKEGK